LLSSAAVTLLPWALGRGRAATGLSFKLFDGHAHLRSEDRLSYPRVAGTPSGGGGPPPAAGPPPPPAAAGDTPDVDRVLRWMNENGVAGAAAVQHRGTYGYDNRYILNSADQHPDRLAPVAVLNAEDPQTPALIDEWVRSHGLAGVRITGMRGADGSFSWLNSPQALMTWAAVDNHGLVMDLMTSPPGNSPDAIAAISELAQQYKRARLVLDHVAWPDAVGAPDFGLDAPHLKLAGHRNIYYKFSTINLDFLRTAQVPAEDMLRHVVDVYGADHVLWGSDIGNSAGPYRDMVSRMMAATVRLKETEKRQVLHDTGAAVYRRGGVSA